MAVSAAVPISEIIFNIERKALDAVATTLAGIDRGCSLTKAVFVPKDGDGNTPTHYALHCLTFQNSDFEGCLHFLKEKALLPATGSIRVTGVGCDRYRDLIESVLGLKVEFVQEYFTISNGTQFLLSHVKDTSSLFYPRIDPDPSMVFKFSEDLKPTVEKQRQEMTKNNASDPEALLPCIYVLVGSASVAIILYPDGTAERGSSTLVAGRALLALGKALAGTSDYNELMELAKNGNASNVDTTVKDYLTDDPNSSYGQFPPELPLFTFGKLIDSDKTLDSFKQTDRAAAVVLLIARGIMSVLRSTCVAAGISRVIVGGHAVKGEPMRAAMTQLSTMFAHSFFDMKFLRTGTTGAIGAMVLNKDIVEKMKATQK